MDLRHLIRDVADFPKTGIAYRDVLPMLAESAAFAEVVHRMAAPWRQASVQVVAGVEARGFMLAGALAHTLKAGFLPLRKAGKLPGPLHSVHYALEYGEATLEVQSGVLLPGTRVLLVDDVLATGGTLCAGLELLSRLRVERVGVAVLLELAALGGRGRIPGTIPVQALIQE